MIPGNAPDFLWSTGTPTGDGISTGLAPRSVPDSSARRIPGEAGIWIFILGDLSIFGAIFIAFARAAYLDRSTFAAQAHHLYVAIGAVNAVVLLTSSWCVASALAHGRSDDLVGQARRLWAATALGGVFCLIKAAEWILELHAGHTPASSSFFTFYFVLCGIHLLHLLIGSALLVAWRRGNRTALFAECAALYWHMVDLLWVMIFAIVYVAVPQ